MKSLQSYLHVCECIYKDAFAMCSTEKSDTERDLITIKSRTENEGLSFLTITLSNFAQDFERSLEHGQISPYSFSGWKKNKSLPAFLQGLMRNVFSCTTGLLLDDPCINSIYFIRQICYLFKKVALPCTPKREYKAMQGYKLTEQSLSEFTPDVSDVFIKVSELLWGNMFSDFNHFDLIPKHGPGATVEHISGNQKYDIRFWHERLEPYFPYSYFGVANINHMCDAKYGLDSVDFLDVESEKPVRVCAVPKTQKGPRIIAIEPVCMQYTQQSLSRYIISKIEKSNITRGHINFSDQSVNKRLAMKSSRDQKLACLDLSEASDRVPFSIIRSLISNEGLYEALCACRSRRAQLPDKEVISLSKFASMGSAVCFPIEAIYFFSVIVSSMLERYELPVTLRNIKLVSRSVYVYGDDIFVPVDEVESVIRTLTRYFAKVNSHKSFWIGKFRESCGTDAYGGVDITPIYIRQELPYNRKQVSALLSSISTSNQFYLKGCWHTSSYFKRRVETILGKLNIVSDNSPALGWASFQRRLPECCLPYNKRWNKDLQLFEFKTFVNRPIYKKDKITSWPALNKYFLTSQNRTQYDIVNKEHLIKSARSGTSSIKRRWTIL